jgi:hypothetical protein
MEFMAAEVVEERFLFHWHPSKKFDLSTSLEEELKAPMPKLLPFHYNAIHDIESAWWIGLWMLFFHQPKGHSESSEIASQRQCETDRVFSGTFRYDAWKLLYLEQPDQFLDATIEWISEECLVAVEVLEDVRILLLEIFRNLEKTFPDGLSKLSDKAQVYQDGHHVAFPGGPEADIHKPIQDAFLTAKKRYESRKTELVRV